MSDSNDISHIHDSIRQRVLGDGYAAWRFDSDYDGLDNYSRHIPISTDKGATLTVDAVQHMFRQDFGITNAMVYPVNDHELSIILLADSGNALKTYGWGKHDLGVLEHVSIAKPPPEKNDPQTVLKEMVRLQLTNPTAWVESSKLLTGQSKNAELFLPAEFITRLAESMPGDRSTEFQLKEAVRNAFVDLLPGVPIILYCAESEQGTKVRLSVKRENCAKLDEAIMAAKQQPGTTVVNFQLAREKRAASMTR